MGDVDNSEGEDPDGVVAERDDVDGTEDLDVVKDLFVDVRATSTTVEVVFDISSDRLELSALGVALVVVLSLVEKLTSNVQFEYLLNFGNAYASRNMVT